MQEQVYIPRIKRTLTLKTPIIMGVLNITPNSFSDGGQYLNLDNAIARAKDMEQQGAMIIDVGGESTKPGAEPISAAQELERVIPVIEILQSQTSCVISIDTSKPEVMRQAVAAGASIINDVQALTASGALASAAELGVAICLMHNAPIANDITVDVIAYLQQRVEQCLQAGISDQQIIIDPGFNFQKTYQQSFKLLKNLSQLQQLNKPILVGLSKKLTKSIAKDYNQRIYGDIALAVYSLLQGAKIIRTHDVQATHDAITMLNKIKETD